MKRKFYIRANEKISASIQYDRMGEEFADFMKEIDEYSHRIARNYGLEAKLIEVTEDYYGAPLGSIGVFYDGKQVYDIDICAMDDDDNIIYHMDEEPGIAEYIDEMMQFIVDKMI